MATRYNVQTYIPYITNITNKRKTELPQSMNDKWKNFRTQILESVVPRNLRCPIEWTQSRSTDKVNLLRLAIEKFKYSIAIQQSTKKQSNNTEECVLITF